MTRWLIPLLPLLRSVWPHRVPHPMRYCWPASSAHRCRPVPPEYRSRPNCICPGDEFWSCDALCSCARPAARSDRSSCRWRGDLACRGGCWYCYWNWHCSYYSYERCGWRCCCCYSTVPRKCLQFQLLLLLHPTPEVSLWICQRP